ncbi:BTB/POZ and MATH domain-containing protein 2-like isoform X2 [Carex littledalei]|uniref:BTB/POZ and MATH domain-containing protein 2-like isoform X2 n=1 Tax=Carex littledalei TaxID=544730 RepID=A0A833RD84_9POAL|nr:BTB/POZ and MATH domain-containing protein 2-like isoform X2 [Carex littledalei]
MVEKDTTHRVTGRLCASSLSLGYQPLAPSLARVSATSTVALALARVSATSTVIAERWVCPKPALTWRNKHWNIRRPVKEMASCEGNNNFTTSVCVNRLVSGTHHCKIVGYSAIRDAFTKRVESSSFRIGGLEWAIRCRTFAVKNDHSENFSPHVSFSLVLLTDPAEAITYATQYVRDDCFTVHCSISSVLESTKVPVPVPAPALNLPRHLGNLLESGVGADVNFLVKGEIFRAHRCVLAVRSPVFHAQFFGLMSEKSYDIESIKVEDVEPMVFKGLLNFIYTDLVPEIDTGADGEPMERSDLVKLTQHLLVAADRFLVDHDLYKLAEKRLCERISADTVETTFALAEQYNLHRLKASCIKSGVMPINLFSKMLIC